MIERIVMQTRKSPTGSITALVNRGEAWSPRLLPDAVADIGSGQFRYVVPWSERTVVVRIIGDDRATLDAERPSGGHGGLKLLPDG